MAAKKVYTLTYAINQNIINQLKLNKMKKIFLSIITASFALTAFAQQDAQYTQNQFNSNLILNPAYAGSDAENTSISARWRKQWVNYDGSPRTLSVIGDTRIKSLGLGLSLNVDQLGIQQIITPDLNLSYHAKMGEKGNLSFGMKGGWQSVKSDFTKLSNIDAGDPLYTGSTNFSYPFIGLGMLYYTPKFYIGASMPRYGFDSPSPIGKHSATHSYLYGGVRKQFENEIEIRPAILLKYQSKAPLELDIAMDTWYKNTIGFGAGYRTGDAVNFMLKGNLNKVYLGYSYDMAISKIRTFNTGSHEICIGYKIPKKAKENEQDRNQNGRYF
jgi:type IX secretion system PorP/SprF family membrane protein